MLVLLGIVVDLMYCELVINIVDEYFKELNKKVMVLLDKVSKGVI